MFYVPSNCLNSPVLLSDMLVFSPHHSLRGAYLQNGAWKLVGGFGVHCRYVIDVCYPLKPLDHLTLSDCQVFNLRLFPRSTPASLIHQEFRMESVNPLRHSFPVSN